MKKKKRRRSRKKKKKKKKKKNGYGYIILLKVVSVFVGAPYVLRPGRRQSCIAAAVIGRKLSQ